MKQLSIARAPGLSRRNLLRWVYLGRITVVSGIQVGALLRWLQAAPEQTFLATVVFLVAFLVTGLSYWYTHVLDREAGVNFAYGQVVFDVAMITAIVHITGGGGSVFAPLYILTISAGALLLPLPGGVLIGALASLAYAADIVLILGDTVSGAVAYQILIFSGVALATGWVGDRVRRAGIALGAVESELQQLRLDTADILSTISSGVMTVDGAGRLAYINPSGEQLLGIANDRWYGESVLGEVEEVSPGLGTLLRRTLEDRAPMARYKTVARRNGTSLTLGVTTTVLERQGGGDPSVTAIFQDITDQEHVNELSRRNERLQAIATLSASLAHEIKNPLASIRSAVEQLASPALVEGDRDTLKDLVLGESDRLSRLLADFIEFSRLQLGTVGEVDLVKVARECGILAKQNPDCCRELSVEVVGDVSEVLVQADGDLIHRALFNLVLNAVHFAGSDGVVRVVVEGPETARAPSALQAVRVARLEVSDSGPGIPDEVADKVFDPFFTSRPGGSGLGLSMVHRAVEAHRGAALVDRSDLGGARFQVFLPVVQSAGVLNSGLRVRETTV